MRVACGASVVSCSPGVFEIRRRKNRASVERRGEHLVEELRSKTGGQQSHVEMECRIDQ